MVRRRTPEGQAHKEFFVNEAHAHVDLLLHSSFETESDAPPTNPVEGQYWLIGSNPAGVWTSRARNLAGWTSVTWIFCTAGKAVRARRIKQTANLILKWLAEGRGAAYTERRSGCGY